MTAEVLYKASVLKDLKRLDRREALRIVEWIDADLALLPGKDKAVVGPFKGLFSYRVRDYRIVSTILGGSILVLRIAHRREVTKT